jgi:hypothetical protein
MLRFARSTSRNILLLAAAIDAADAANISACRPAVRKGDDRQ